METQKKNTQGLHLTKSHRRWAWMAGATAAAAASPHTLAQTAQISLINNQIDSVSGVNMTLAVTSGHSFGTIAKDQATKSRVSADLNIHDGFRNYLIASLNHVTTSMGKPRLQAYVINTDDIFFPVQHHGTQDQTAFALLPFRLTDPNVADGQANTNALLEFEAFNQSSSDQTVALLAVFYPESGNTTPDLTINSTDGDITGDFTNVGSSDDGVFTAVPEPTCSSLALLALGAGGILARRARKKAA